MLPTSFIATITTSAISILLFNIATAHKAHQSTVGDLVECLGNKTRFRIAQDGPGLFITSPPYNSPSHTVEDYHDDAVSNCIIALRMPGVVQEVVPLEKLYPIVSTREEDMEAVEVPDDFVPKSKTDYNWDHYEEDKATEVDPRGERGGLKDATQLFC
ncbi:uncharacterized protein UTRI_05113 [Ustilago trichophora]|uniref:Uncharacterized protein n=1 Tax=Ustilago trichophora TaxID=86804 RepID=A0A5C3ECP1_9BASI|nr:uncharacterized protein UTRI_05113 [Ustilago trichophora]